MTDKNKLPIKAIDLQVLLKIVDDMDEESATHLLLRLFEIYLQETPRRINSMKEAIKHSDKDQLRNSAHVLKSSSAMLGAIEASTYSSELEKIGRNVGSTEKATELLLLLEKECEQVMAELRALMHKNSNVLYSIEQRKD
ncbi:Hpt domain-containing protein [Heliorestis acidaminivorans]|uniref:Hpt domain-containing protein n=1 Tax=Heliorestis acidaminivorans TaxID=553427 RepID=A0A6I0EX76_9FIRM|nr:Hpt domain-containing protein [Heliorestis acidaminivorans]KAB2952880.1 Hpt domain-containing protein [Heliorestis acidaminivorans]